MNPPKQKITTCLWFDDRAPEAIKFYTSIFPHAKILDITHYGKNAPLPEGSFMTGTFEIDGVQIMLLNGGEQIKPNPSISLFVPMTSVEKLEEIWEKLADGGKVMMELQEYPFSKRYGWLEDRYGVSWQLMHSPEKGKVAPSLMFVGKNAGKAQEAMEFYTSLFPHSKINMVSAYEQGEGDVVGYLKYASFTLANEEFKAMDSSGPHKFTFTWGVSLSVACETQAEIDHLWDALLEGGEPSQCGWLADKYGVSWQIVPAHISKWTHEGGAKMDRVMQALWKMVKIDIATLEKAYEGK